MNELRLEYKFETGNSPDILSVTLERTNYISDYWLLPSQECKSYVNENPDPYVDDATILITNNDYLKWLERKCFSLKKQLINELQP